MEKRVADSDKAFVEMEGRWSYVAGTDKVNSKDYAIFQDRVDDARACRNELEAECAIKSKRLIEYQEEILKQLSAMETDLASLKAEKRNLMIPLPGWEKNDGYCETLRKAWEDAEKRTRDAGLNCHAWPVHRALNAAEYAKELMLHLSNIIPDRDREEGAGTRD